MTDEMRRYAHDQVARLAAKHGLHDALIQALYTNGRLRLEYGSSFTRTAAQAFEARAGNCLSLVIMTAAFARELGIVVRYQTVESEENWSRNGDLLISRGHVNITLGGRVNTRLSGLNVNTTIDFLPPDDLAALRTREIPESRIVAMFMNNRAVEALVDGRLNDAFAWAREGLRAEPGDMVAFNTLGLVYSRRGALEQAASVYEHVLAREPTHVRALANLAELRLRQGREEDAARLRARLARLEPFAPMHFFNLGRASMEHEDFHATRKYFAKEAARGNGGGAVYYWLGMASLRLGEFERAKRELQLALDVGATRNEREIYAAKLDRLQGQRSHWSVSRVHSGNRTAANVSPVGAGRKSPLLWLAVQIVSGGGAPSKTVVVRRSSWVWRRPWFRLCLSRSVDALPRQQARLCPVSGVPTAAGRNAGRLLRAPGRFE